MEKMAREEDICTCSGRESEGVRRWEGGTKGGREKEPSRWQPSPQTPPGPTLALTALGGGEGRVGRGGLGIRGPFL